MTEFIDKIRSYSLIAGLTGLCMGLQACSMSNLTSGLGTDLFSSKKKQQEQAAVWSPTVTEGSLLAAAKQNQDLSTLLTAEKGCPRFVIWSKGRHFTRYENPVVKEPTSVMYRGEITKIARECEIAAGRITIKYGFSGRLLLGPKAKSDQYALPVVLTVTGKARGKLKEERLNVPIIIEKGQPVGYFTRVRRITFDIPEGSQVEDFKLFVSFDKDAEQQGGA